LIPTYTSRMIGYYCKFTTIPLNNKPLIYHHYQKTLISIYRTLHLYSTNSLCDSDIKKTPTLQQKLKLLQNLCSYYNHLINFPCYNPDSFLSFSFSFYVGFLFLWQNQP
jgi:hypothetical protein